MAASFDNLSGELLGKYRIVSRIGKGGMATVYRATQPGVERDVAIKVLPPQFLHDDSFLRRFEREAQSIARLQHPRILPIYDYGEHDGLPYIVMAYMPGGTLADAIRYSGGGLSPDDTVHLVDQIAEALDFAHSKGIIHRDFKPSNVLLDEMDNVYLADFGIAKVIGATAQLTGNAILGTPAYMAPEMATPDAVSSLIDIYALGVTIYQMLAGDLPYKATTPMGILLAHTSEPIPNIHDERPGLPDAVQGVIERAMAKSPARRYQSAGALANGLRAALTSEPFFEATADTAPASQRTVPETLPPARPAPRATPPPAAPPRARPEKRGRGFSPLLLAVIGLGGLALVGGILLGGFFLFANRGNFLAGGAAVATNTPRPGVPTVTPIAAGETAQPPTDAPPPTEDDSPEPTPAPTEVEATVMPDQTADIEQAVLDFDREMRYVLETGDTSRIASEAAGQALQDRLDAADILNRAGDCHWDYDHRGIDFVNLTMVDSARAVVQASLDRDGTVICPDGERSQYAFTGPYMAEYLVELQNGEWIVTDYCPADQCPNGILES
jgi:tRNA A-37 threonylcarbamoyl transferase component Bud32